MIATAKNFLRPVKRFVERVAGRERISRQTVARHYLSGRGIEIGALHLPLSVPRGVTVRYVDRMPIDALRHHYPELAKLPLVPLDVIDDGETLSTLADASEDFVTANHFLEHTQDPIGTIRNLMRVLKPGGVLFMAVPDKRSTFDYDRAITSVEHMVRDHEQGPAGSRAEHYEEMVRHTERLDGAAAADRVRHLMEIDYSIHFHVWDAASYLRLLSEARDRLGFEIEFAMVSGIEIISVLRKPGGDADHRREESARDMLALTSKSG